MKTPLKALEEKFQKAAHAAYPSLNDAEGAPPPLEVTASTQEKFGHYQFNSAMRLSKILKAPPREIAQKIIDRLDKGEIIETLEIAGPGFINITLSEGYLTKKVQEMANGSHLGVDLPEVRQRIIVDFSSPNIAKELHVGHLRSTIIGDCLARLFEFLGHDVLRLNHIGDWGTAFGMLIAYLKEEAPDVLTGDQKTDLSHLVAWYKAAKSRFDSDAAFKKRSQEEVSTLQGGDPTSLKAWEIICTISQNAYQEVYDLLDVKIQDRGESFYNPMLPGIVEELKKKGLLTLSDGAECIFLEGFKNREGEPLPFMVQKSDGGYNYATTDLAAMKQRTEEERADRIIIVTDAGQSTHFQMLKKAAEKAGLLNSEKVRFDHVPFGVVLGPDGKKFKTRSGETEKLIDLITNAIDRASTIIEERSPNIDGNERKRLANALGIGAIKYADLCCHRTSDYTFSYDRMLRFEGNTAAFILYSYVRIAGIKRKIGREIKEDAAISLKHPSELALGLHLTRFGEMLDQVATDLLPNRLTEYLYGLANAFNSFYRDCPVEGSEHQEARLLLSETAARTLKKGLHILGLETVERM